MLRPHGFIKLVCLVHFIGFDLFGVEPALEELGIVFREGLIALLDLAKFEL